MSSTFDEQEQWQPEGSERLLGGFGWLLALAAVFNFLLFPMLRAMESGDGAIVLFGAAAVGLFPAQAGTLTLWLVWGPGSFVRRLAIHWLAALALFTAWAMGIAIAFGSDGPAQELPRVWGTVLCSLPLVSLAGQLPLWLLRTHLGWRVERLEGEAQREPRLGGSLALPHGPLPPARQPLSIRDILLGTVVTAVTLAGVRLVAAMVDADRGMGQLDAGYWLAWGIAVLIIAAISLLGFLPALWLLLRHRDTGQAMGLWLGYAAVACFVMLVFMASLFGGGPSPEPFVGLVCLLSSFALGLAVPLLLVRARGWRLILPGDSTWAAGSGPGHEIPSTKQQITNKFE